MSGIEVVLTCAHVRWWSVESHAPKASERVWCYACTDMRDVVGRIGEYLVQCKDCRFRRTYSSDVGLARGVRKHLQTHPSHITKIAQIGKDDSVDVRWADPGTTLDQAESMF